MLFRSIYPLWLGTMPAALKALLEQSLRPDFAMDYTGRWPAGRLKGRSARVVVTMGMPELAYRWWFGAHSLKSLERNVLKFVGISRCGKLCLVWWGRRVRSRGKAGSKKCGSWGRKGGRSLYSGAV